jgi:hypothetical protein
MEVKVESKIGQLRSNNQRIYTFLSDCNNFRHFAAGDKVKDWQSDAEQCSFSVDSVGAVSIRIVERKPNDLVKFAIENAQAENILLWGQLKEANTENTRVKLTAKLDVNPLLRLVVPKPLKQGLDKIVETLERIC